MGIYNKGWGRRRVMRQIKKNTLGKQSVRENDNSLCMYRTDDGNCCLVGAFIPDSLYDEEMEDKSATAIIEQFNLDGYMPMNASAMEILQNFHDIDLTEVKDKKEFFRLIDNQLKNMQKGK